MPRESKGEDTLALRYNLGKYVSKSKERHLFVTSSRIEVADITILRSHSVVIQLRVFPATMDSMHPLRGACSCGRNQYFVHFSSPASEHLQVFFDDTNTSGKKEPVYTRSGSLIAS